MWSSPAFLRWKWQRDKGQKNWLIDVHVHTLGTAPPRSKNSWWHCDAPASRVLGCMCVRTTFKCAHGSNASFRHLVSRDVSFLKWKLAQPSEGETLENQSHNYPDFHCHFKRNGRQNLAIVAARLQASVTFIRAALCFEEYTSANPSADGESLKGEDAQRRGAERGN